MLNAHMSRFCADFMEDPMDVHDESDGYSRHNKILTAWAKREPHEKVVQFLFFFRGLMHYDRGRGLQEPHSNLRTCYCSQSNKSWTVQSVLLFRDFQFWYVSGSCGPQNFSNLGIFALTSDFNPLPMKHTRGTCLNHRLIEYSRHLFESSVDGILEALV